MYCYGGNNPIKYTDPDGRSPHIVAGAFIGGLVSGVIATCRGSTIRQIGAATVGGAITGALAAATCGASLLATSYGGALAVTVASSSIASVEGYLAEEILLGQSPTLEGIIVTAVSGAEGAMAGSIVGEVASGISKAGSGGSKTLSEAANSIKSCPNPYGKKGGPAHQSVIKSITKDAKILGKQYSTEVQFKTPGGNKNSRYADVVIFDNNGQISEIHQVGRTNKSGTPVSREVKAMNDIKNAPQYNGAPIYFHPYDR